MRTRKLFAGLLLGLFVIGFVQAMEPKASGMTKEPTWQHIENMQVCRERSGIFFSIARYYGNGLHEREQWLVDITSGAARAICKESRAFDAELSPDARKLVYSFADPEEPGSYLVKAVDLHNKRSQLIARKQNPSTPHWSSDGRWIAFSVAAENKKNLRYVRIVDSKGLLADRFSNRPLSDQPSWVWHPSGSKLLYSTGWGRKASIIMLDVESLVETTIVEGHRLADFPEMTVTFSPDASQFFFLEHTRRWPCGPWKKRPRICSITEKTVRKPNMPKGFYDQARWSPDGESIAGILEVEAADEKDQPYLFIWNVLTEQAQLIPNIHEIEQLEWLLDGNLVCSDGRRIFILTIEGKETRETKELYRIPPPPPPG